ncbi:50S ribosomal protein L19 [bacterium]|nr:50S ribosomal protein L19 [bacterium]
MQALEFIEKKYNGVKQFPQFKSGDTVKIHVKIKEGDKERVQIFQGAVIRIHRAQARTTFTVRKVSYGVGVERVFPLYSPVIQKIEVVMSGRVRRSRLYYLRDLQGKKARIFAEERGIVSGTADTTTEPVPA